MFKKSLIILLSIFFLSFAPLGVLAQEERNLTDTQELQQLYDSIKEEADKNLDDGYMYTQDTPLDTSYDSLTPEEQEALGGIAALGAGVILVIALVGGILGLVLYVFTSLALMKIAKKLNMENGWWAWVPVLNMVLLAQMGDVNPWTLLLALIPGVNVIYLLYFAVVTGMKMSEKLGLEKMLGLLMLVPVVQYFFLGYLAWGKFETKVQNTSVVEPTPDTEQEPEAEQPTSESTEDKE